MADAAAEEKAKAEKLAAAKKRVEQLKKQKGKKKKGDKDAAAAAAAADDKPEPSPGAPEDAKDEAAADEPQEPADAAEEPAPAAAEEPAATEDGPEEEAAAPSLSAQSKARSTSFRKAPASAGPLSPGGEGGETAPDIYRKHVARIEELERENKRLAKEAADSEKRWQKAEDELADLRESEGKPGGDSEAEKLKNEIAALQRQNAQLQTQVSRGSANRHGSSPSISMAGPPSTELEAQLQSKSAAIETMELEMSRLRAQVERLAVASSGAADNEQVAALEEKLARAEKAAALAQRELGDLKRNLERTTEKAVRESSERVSAETKLRTLERESGEAAAARAELARKAEALEKKVATLTTLHKEQDARTQALRKDKEKADRELADLRARLDRAEADNVRLRKREARDGGGTDDDHLDELENEERLRVERRLRELEAENSDLRRGIWHERRKEMQVGPDQLTSPSGGRFTDVDLGGAGGAGGPLAHGGRRAGGVGGITDLFTSGLNALAGGGGAGAAAAPHDHDRDGFLDDDDMEFDEEAFRRAQEEEARKRIERIKEIKRTLKNWEGWRLDIVESRRAGGEGLGEIFDV